MSVEDLVADALGLSMRGLGSAPLPLVEDVAADAEPSPLLFYITTANTIKENYANLKRSQSFPVHK